MPLLRPSPIAYASVFLLLAACGGSVANGSTGDDGGAGRDGNTPPGQDSGVDAKGIDAFVPDGGCAANPAVGGTCSPGEQSCTSNCCQGFEWECDVDTETWEQQAVHCACGVDGGVPDSSITEVPDNHRPDDSACATVPPAGTCGMGDPGGMCTSDSDCTDGTNGRCNESTGGALFCSCQYDSCQVDTDCPTGQLCACHGSAYFESEGNTCEPGNCRVDSDCGTNGYCSPSAGGGCGGLSGYYCHTASDACVNDSDCSGTSGFDSCQFSTTDEKWECTMEELCG